MASFQMFSQQMATHELLNNNVIQHYLGSYELSDSVFCLTDGESQPIEYSQFPSSQELFSSNQPSGKETSSSMNQPEVQLLPNLCESNKNISVKVSELRSVAAEKDERTLLGNISNAIKQYQMEFSNLHKAIQEWTELKNEFSRMNKAMQQQAQEMTEKLNRNVSISMELDNKIQTLSNILDEKKEQEKEVNSQCLQLLTLQESLKEKVTGFCEPVVQMQKMFCSYQKINEKQYMELKEQQRELSRNFTTLQEMILELFAQLTERDGALDSFNALKGNNAKNKPGSQDWKYKTSSFNHTMLDTKENGNDDLELLKAEANRRNVKTGNNTGRNMTNGRASIHLRRNYLQKNQKLNNNKHQMKDFLRTTNNVSDVYSNDSEKFAKEVAKPLTSSAKYNSYVDRNSNKCKNNPHLQNSLMSTNTNLSIVKRTTTCFRQSQDASEYGLFYEERPSPEVYKSVEVSTKSNVQRKGNSRNMFHGEQNGTVRNNSKSRVLSVSRFVSKEDEAHSNGSSPSLSFATITSAISKASIKRRATMVYD